MNTRSLSEGKRLWDTAGWCVIEDVFPADDVAAALRALPSMFPTAEEFASNANPERNLSFHDEARAPKPQFPIHQGPRNRLVVHDAMLDLAELLLEADDVRLYQAMANAKYSDGSRDYDQLLHVDYANHTLLVPRDDFGYHHL
jgi:hypothetical protein